MKIMKNKLSKNDALLRLVETAILLALAIVLNSKFVPNFPLPFGGSVTIFGQLPIVLIAYRYGAKWALPAAILFGFTQLLFGWGNAAAIAQTFGAYLIFILFDYLLAFGSLGLAGIFRNKIKNEPLSLAVGSVFASILRYLCHFISGVTIWQAYADEKGVLLYSITYNGSYMIPEMIITAIGAFGVAGVLKLANKNK